MNYSAARLNQLFLSTPIEYNEEVVFPATGPQFWSEEREFDEESLDSQYSHSTWSSTSSLKASRYKTEKCRQYYENGHCMYGDNCLFAHSAHELRDDPLRPKYYKTRVCTTYQFNGYCPFGSRCAFVHSRPDPIELIEAVVSASPRPPMPENKTKVRPEFYPSALLVRKKTSDTTLEEELLPSIFNGDLRQRLPAFARLTSSSRLA